VRVTILASGSGGNATLVSAGGSRILVDAGVSKGVIESRMRSALGASVGVHGLVLTHPHGDHVGKAKEVARHFDCPIWMTEATSRRLRLGRLPTRVFGFNTPFDIGNIRVEPMPVPHDAPNVALVFDHRGTRAGLVTDLGHVPRKLAAHLARCQLVLLEANHDPAMLADGPYPDFLKKRVASRVGHLSNQQAAHLAARLGRETREIVLMHLSEKNNAPMLALAQVRAALAGRRVSVRCAHQDQSLDLSIPEAVETLGGPRADEPGTRRRKRRGGLVHVNQLALPF